jgi:hypothetical protein
LEGDPCALQEGDRLGDCGFVVEVEGEVELPGVGGGQAAVGVGKREADLYELGLLDVVPDEHVV